MTAQQAPRPEYLGAIRALSIECKEISMRMSAIREALTWVTATAVLSGGPVVGTLGPAQAVVGAPAPASASASVFAESNWGKLRSNNSLASYPKCLISPDNQDSSVHYDAGSVRQDRCLSDSGNQLWHFNPIGGGYYTIESGGHDGFCLDVYAFNHDNYGLVTTWPCNSFINQQWYVNWVSDNSFTLKPRHAIFDGPYYIDSNGHWSPRGKCLDVFAFAHNDGAPVVQWECNGAVNQLWTYQPMHF